MFGIRVKELKHQIEDYREALLLNRKYRGIAERELKVLKTILNRNTVNVPDFEILEEYSKYEQLGVLAYGTNIVDNGMVDPWIEYEPIKQRKEIIEMELLTAEQAKQLAKTNEKTTDELKKLLERSSDFINTMGNIKIVAQSNVSYYDTDIDDPKYFGLIAELIQRLGYSVTYPRVMGNTRMHIEW